MARAYNLMSDVRCLISDCTCPLSRSVLVISCLEGIFVKENLLLISNKIPIFAPTFVAKRFEE